MTYLQATACGRRDSGHGINCNLKQTPNKHLQSPRAGSRGCIWLATLMGKQDVVSEPSSCCRWAYLTWLGVSMRKGSVASCLSTSRLLFCSVSSISSRSASGKIFIPAGMREVSFAACATWCTVGIDDALFSTPSGLCHFFFVKGMYIKW